jgi:hypothetical protein
MRTQQRNGLFATGFFSVMGMLLFAVPAHAAGVQNFSTNGTEATVQTATADNGGCVTVSVFLEGVTSITRSDGTKSTGSVATGDVQLFNTCTGITEFGSIFADVGTGFSTGAQSATLNATIVVQMFQFDANFNFLGFVDRTLVASGLTWASNPTETFVSRSHSRTTFPGTKSVSNGRSTEHDATISGVLTVDGQNLLSASAFALFSTSANSSVTLTTN